ncbi:MAG: preprotein translocase subunit SecG [candidate division Zixibacteria bacterium]|nr:preprotein translocase subunit SecG [candidate division Zixibacteria bacterium]
MYGVMIALHLFICLGLIIVVLLQSSKGEGLAGGFGGSALTGTVFGGRGAASFLAKATTVLAIAFFASAVLLSFIRPSGANRSAVQGSSAVEEAARQNTANPEGAPATQSATEGAPQTKPQTQQPNPAQATPIEQLNPEAKPQTKPGDSGKK